MDGKGWIKPTFHPLALGPPVIFRRFAKNQPREKEQHLPKVQDESHAFVNHTSPNARSPPPSPSSALRTTSSAASPSASRARPLLLSAPPLSPSLRARPHACSSAQLIVRRPTSIMSTAGASYGRLQPSATAPALHGTSERQSTPGRPSQMALRPQPSHNWLPEATALDPNPRPATVGPNLAYTNYHALSTPLVRRWVRTPREPANVPPAKPGYYAAHESAHTPSNLVTALLFYPAPTPVTGPLENSPPGSLAVDPPRAGCAASLAPATVEHCLGHSRTRSPSRGKPRGPRVPGGAWPSFGRQTGPRQYGSFREGSSALSSA